MALFALTTAGMPTSARAEVTTAESIEWLSVDATRVLTGKVTSMEGPGTAATGKDRGLTLLTVQVADSLKNAPPAGDSLCVAVRGANEAELRDQLEHGAELLFFLSRTIQASSYQGRSCDSWPARSLENRPLVISLTKPGKPLLSAVGFRVLKTRNEILDTIRDILKNQASQTGNVAARRFVLEVPRGTELYKTHSRGSAVYLYVPDTLFPKARASQHP